MPIRPATVTSPRSVFSRNPLPLVGGRTLAALAALTAALPAAAQWGGWGYGSGMAVTAGQAADYGYSAVINSEGQANLSNSEAAKNWEQAKSMEIDNRAKWTETYFDMRRTNREKRAEEEGPRVTQEQAIRIAKMATPPRLDSTQLDPLTGHIEYPLVLRDGRFAENRSQLDSLFAHRASTQGSIDFEDHRKIRQTVSNFIDALKAHVNDYSANDYGRARTFLDSLLHELRFPISG
ncbi:MAG: hypothetical protein FJ309_00395 [Planctomycetes bacterium]|nr:hypothetical protein [Planctomycetota bacterium]